GERTGAVAGGHPTPLAAPPSRRGAGGWRPAMSDGKGDPVGYRRPPRANRFKPGQSGNPKGRPKGSKNFATAIQAELDSRIVATENGKRRKITKLDALAKQIVNKAVSGELRAIPVLLNEMRQIE